MKTFLYLFIGYLAVIGLGVALAFGLDALFHDAPESTRECYIAEFFERPFPDNPNFIRIDGYLCGDNIEYLFGEPDAPVVNLATPESFN